MDFNTIINILIPVLIVIFFIGIFYVKLKQPVDTFFIFIGRSIGHLFMKGKEASESIIVEDVITYD